MEAGDIRTTHSRLPRGARPDGITEDAAHLIKLVSVLRLTYQIRLLTFLTGERWGQLVIHVPSDCRVSDRLERFLTEHPAAVRIERLGSQIR
jgi:hypothetical protein